MSGPTQQEIRAGIRGGLLDAFLMLLATVILGFVLVRTVEILSGAEPKSELRFHTDEETGCEYVAGPLQGVTPRLDKNGWPMCGGSHE